MLVNRYLLMLWTVVIEWIVDPLVLAALYSMTFLLGWHTFGLIPHPYAARMGEMVDSQFAVIFGVLYALFVWGIVERIYLSLLGSQSERRTLRQRLTYIRKQRALFIERLVNNGGLTARGIRYTLRSIRQAEEEPIVARFYWWQWYILHFLPLPVLLPALILHLLE